MLCGMMGAGKSAVGRSLADSLGWAFLDTDDLIENDAGTTIAEIFEREGEGGFRKRESEVISKLPARRTVIALGGGAVLDEGNRARLLRTGTLVWLQAGPREILDRVGDADTRPLLADLNRTARLERLKELLEERHEAYAAAELHVDTTGRDVREICAEVRRALQLEVTS